MANDIDPIQILIANALAAKQPNYLVRSELLAKAFNGEDVDSRAWRKYWGSIPVEQAMESVRHHYRRVVAAPEPQPCPGDTPIDSPNEINDGVISPSLAVVPPQDATCSILNTEPVKPEFWHKPHPKPLPDLPPIPEQDSPEERIRKARARKAFKSWTGWLKWKDEGGSGGNGDGGGWLNS